ncbi:chymotrypsin-1-like [Ostrinia furnacalis]|uniref:chymotrypsin-1-like n=1 Tax=Ostrinia furnacalis TaxID=93504 RepID=UPI00103B22E8|nr:chymotrypsin-1-like [Ostrinia furnacalis]
MCRAYNELARAGKDIDVFNSKFPQYKKAISDLLKNDETTASPGGNDQSHLTGYILNGVDVPISMYPYMALIGRFGRVHCGGSVVSDRVILTAAHCLCSSTGHILPAKTFDVYLGSAKALDGTKYKVCKTLPHARYGTVLYGYDLGLMLLNKNIKFGATVQKIAPVSNSQWKKKASMLTVIGFGVTSNAGKLPETLQMTKMYYINETQCFNSQHGMPFPIVLPSHMFCMIGERWTSDCFGDSGSPVIWKRNIVGLVSSGRDNFCGSDMMPSMYTDVRHFNKWLDDNVRDLEENTECNIEQKQDPQPKDIRTYANDRYGEKLAARYTKQTIELVLNFD